MKFIRQNLRNNLRGIALMFMCNFFLSTGQLFWKLIPVYGIKLIFVGFVCYGIGALFMIFAYRFGELSVLQPMNCFSYIFMIIFADIILNEHISLRQYAGIIFIIAGVVFIGGSETQ